MIEPQPRELPSHIAAALKGAGGETDTAGQPWAGRELHGQYHNFEQDDGAADPGYQHAKAELLEGLGSEAAVVQSLAKARVFVPIVAELSSTEQTQHGLTADKESEMALVTLQAPDGRRALPVFSSTASLENWHPEARPVAVYAARAALSAVAEDAQLMVVDPGADYTFVLRRPALWALAQQNPWTPSYADPVLQETVRRIAESTATEFSEGAGSLLLGLELHPGAGVRSVAQLAAGQHKTVHGGGAGPELRLLLLLSEGLAGTTLQDFLVRLQTQLAAEPMFAERVTPWKSACRARRDKPRRGKTQYKILCKTQCRTIGQRVAGHELRAVSGTAPCSVTA